MVVQASQLNNNEENKETAPKDNSESLVELLKKNIKLSEDILKISKKINNFVIWQKVIGVLKILIIVLPLVLGYYYLQPYFRELQDTYFKLIGLSETVQNINNSVPPDLLKNLIK